MEIIFPHNRDSTTCGWSFLMFEELTGIAFQMSIHSSRDLRNAGIRLPGMSAENLNSPPLGRTSLDAVSAVVAFRKGPVPGVGLPAVASRDLELAERRSSRSSSVDQSEDFVRDQVVSGWS
jgi:hypothetical protein